MWLISDIRGTYLLLAHILQKHKKWQLQFIVSSAYALSKLKGSHFWLVVVVVIDMAC